MPPSRPAGISSRTVLYTVLLAVVVRLLYLTEHAGTALFAYPVLDELYYATVARQLAAGDSVTAINPGFRPLLYPMLLAPLVRLESMALPAAIVCQHLLGVVNAVLVALLAFRLGGSNRLALVAAALFVLAGPPLYFEGQILNTALATFLGLALVLTLASLPRRAAGPGALVGWGAAGALLGLAMQARPNVVLFALALPLALWVWRRREDRLEPRFAVAAGLGLLLCLAAFGALQRPHFERFQLLPGSGGVNFYLGNKRGADGMVPRQDRRVTYAGDYRDSVQVFARQEYARAAGVDPMSPSARRISRWWLRRGLSEIAADPGAWTGLMLRKTWYLLWNREIPNNKSYAFVLAEESPLLRLLPVRWWLLVALAPLGVLWCLRRGDRWVLFWLTSFCALWGAGVVLFFVNGRYRAPLWPFLCILAACGGARLWQQARALRAGGRWRPLAASAALAAALAAVSLGNWAGIDRPAFDRELFYRSLAHLDRGRLDLAAADAERAVALDPGEPAYVFQLGNVRLAGERWADAATAFRRAGELKPVEPRIWNNLGIAEERLGRPGAALAAYHRAIEQVGDYAPALTNAALLELRAGRVDEAERHLDAALAAGDDSIHLLCGRALLARARGDEANAERLLAAARQRDPETTARLERESRRPLALAAPPG